MLAWCSVIISFTLRLFTFSFTNLTFNLSLPLSLSLCSYREGDTSMVSLCYASEQCYLSLSLPITKWVYVCITHMTWRDAAIFKLNLNWNSDYILPACPHVAEGGCTPFFHFFFLVFFLFYQNCVFFLLRSCRWIIMNNAFNEIPCESLRFAIFAKKRHGKL